MDDVPKKTLYSEQNPHQLDLYLNSMNPINQRALKILQEIVECYIREGQPIASKTLARAKGMSLSSATLRSIMSELEAAGYLISPHTSAGRVPTTQAYRLFVDHLLMLEHPVAEKMTALRAQLSENTDAAALLTQASSVLSDLTGLVAMVSLPKHEQMVLRQIEFLPLSRRRVLVVLVMQDHQVENRIMSVDRDYARHELERLGNYLTVHFSGCELGRIRQQLLQQLDTDREHLDNLLNVLMAFMDNIDSKAVLQDFCLSGQAHLFEVLGQENYAQLQRLFEAVSEKRDILAMFDRVLDAESLQIFIGEESGHEALQTCSVVTAPYAVSGKMVGVLGVIGPTRMPYRRVISAVDVTATLLSEAFCQEA